ncbi:uncharacterized protein AAG666_012379 isoform 1-T1 [Megaptera novaeangliae]
MSGQWLPAAGLLLAGPSRVTRSVTFRITNEAFSAALGNPASLEYQLLSENIRHQLQSIYHEAFSSFQGVGDLLFRPDSAAVNASLVFGGPAPGPSACEVLWTLYRKVKAAGKILGNLSLDESSLASDGESPPAPPPKTPTSVPPRLPTDGWGCSLEGSNSCPGHEAGCGGSGGSWGLLNSQPWPCRVQPDRPGPGDHQHPSHGHEALPAPTPPAWLCPLCPAGKDGPPTGRARGVRILYSASPGGPPAPLQAWPINHLAWNIVDPAVQKSSIMASGLALPSQGVCGLEEWGPTQPSSPHFVLKRQVSVTPPSPAVLWRSPSWGSCLLHRPCPGADVEGLLWSVQVQRCPFPWLLPPLKPPSKPLLLPPRPQPSTVSASTLTTRARAGRHHLRSHSKGGFFPPSSSKD